MSDYTVGSLFESERWIYFTLLQLIISWMSVALQILQVSLHKTFPHENSVCVPCLHRVSPSQSPTLHYHDKRDM
jgi:hypothetical protein